MRKDNDNQKRNKDGYIDLTAYKAIKNVEREEKKKHGCKRLSQTTEKT